MKKIYIQILIFLSFSLMFSSTIVVGQKTEKGNKITIESIVKDEKGNPIKGATVYGNEGSVIVKTDDSGKFSILISDQSPMLIESDGYESIVLRAGEYKNMKEFILKTSLFLYGENDNVNIAFQKVKKGDIVGSVSVVNPEDLLHYDNIQSIYDVLNGHVTGLLGSSNIRGLGSPFFIVDGLPRDISTINLQEVEQITVLKDINSSMLYGNGAVNGVVQITTKRGQAHKKQVNVTGYYGISKPTALPEFLNSADYAELYNEALVNDGLSPQYDAASIANYRTGNQYRYPSVDYFSSNYIKSVKPFSRLTTEFSGGNDVATYYSNLGWYNEGSLLNFGEGKNGKTNIFNARGNVDIKINSWIKSSVDAVAIFNNKTDQIRDYWAPSFTLRPNLFSPLLPFDVIDPNLAAFKGRKNDVNGMYMLGGTSVYLTNPIADGYSGGIRNNIQRTFSFNNRLDFDLGNVVKGLAFHTNVSFDLYFRYDQNNLNGYAVYNPAWSPTADSIRTLTKYALDTKSGSQDVGNSFFDRKFGFYGMLDYNRIFSEVHHITGSLIGYGYRDKIQGDFQGTKNVNLGLNLGYSYKNKYMVDFSSAYVHSVKLPEGNRDKFSPSFGLAWMISSEDFLSSVSAIDYLKLRVTGGMLNSDAGIPGFYYYDPVHVRSGTYQWFDAAWSNNGTISSYGGNSNLGFETRREINFGIEGLLFNRMIGVEANIFKSSYYDQITRPTTTVPSFFTSYMPYKNFDNNGYSGAELGLTFNKSLGDISFTLGANMLYADSKVLKRDEIYADEYQNRKGKPVDAYFGLVADGFFANQADIDSHPFQAFGIVKPGDIKYVDQNNDDVIDDKDQIQIGRWQAPFSYGLNLRLSWKSLTLFVKGTGRIGADTYSSNDYYWVDGTDKYSEVVLDRWTPATATTATYPRLSSQANLNNYRSSTFWLYRNNYFILDRMQLTYDMPQSVAKMLRMEMLSFFVDGSRLLTVSKHKDVMDLSLGTEPYYRSFSLGIKTMF